LMVFEPPSSRLWRKQRHSFIPHLKARSQPNASEEIGGDAFPVTPDSGFIAKKAPPTSLGWVSPPTHTLDKLGSK
ncbi:MAG TPA: hypothetical protein VHM88_16690, partial [Candidatus Acidoferrales bacterium]|nr:hypothetical protein [Candidatus Acidoferrales bacterium]